MDEYIRDFDCKEVETHLVGSVGDFNARFSSLANNFRIFHLNIRSLSENIGQLVVFLKQFTTEFDVIVLTETFKIHDLGIFSLSGYSMIYNNGDVNKNDGVVIYIKNYIRFQHKIVCLNEIKLLQVTFSIGSRSIVLSALYRLHPTDPHTFNTNLHSYLKTLKNDFSYSILIGDININILNQKDYTQEYLNILSEEGYISQINKFTRVEKNKKSCIDHIFVKQKKPVLLYPAIIEDLITDHYPVMLVMDFVCPPSEKLNQVKTFIDYDKLRRLLNSANWEYFYSLHDTEIMANTFIGMITESVDRCTCTKKVTRSEVPRKTWITPGLVKSMNVKNTIYRNMLRNPHDEHILEIYRAYKNRLAKLIKVVKRQYYEDIINKKGKSMKHLYESVNEICGSVKRANNTIKEIKLPDGQITDCKHTIADKFNEHYIEYPRLLASKIAKTEYADNIKPLQNSIFLAPQVVPDTVRIINGLKNDTAPGMDGITTRILKEIENDIALPLTHIINKVFDTGTWPTAFGTGVIKPIYKSGDPLDMTNYRPISLISQVAKVAEKALKDRVVNFLDKNNVISDLQFGFREARSAQDAIACLTDNIYKALDKTKPTMCIFVDLAKAFDTVSHRLLLVKLEKYGFRGKVQKLISSYLENRIQRVKIGNEISNPRRNKYGVPQGTVLGPILFLLYINDLLNIKTRGKIISYADDTAIIYTDETWEALRETVESDFIDIKNWFSRNLLTLNPTKTTFLTFSSYPRVTLSDINVVDKHSALHLRLSETVKYLGVTIDRFFRWNIHINHVVRKLRGLLSRFKVLREFLNVKQLKIMYFSLIQSHLNYGIIGWGGAYKNHLTNLETIQKWFLKIIFYRKKTYPSDDLYSEANVLDLRQLFSYTILLRLFTHREHISQISHSYDTRQRGVLCTTTKCSKTVGQRCFVYVGQKLYNELPGECRNYTVSYATYRGRIKNWMFSLPRQNIHSLIDS